MSDGKTRKDIQIGIKVEVVQKHHQRSGELTEGIVKKILTNSSTFSTSGRPWRRVFNDTKKNINKLY